MNKLLLFFSFSSGALAAPAQVSTILTPEGSYAVALKAVEDGFEANWSASWKLETSESNVKIKSTDLKQSLPGYVVDVEASKGGSLGYKVVAYFCRADKSECRRKVFEGTVGLGVK